MPDPLRAIVAFYIPHPGIGVVTAETLACGHVRNVTPKPKAEHQRTAPTRRRCPKCTAGEPPVAFLKKGVGRA